MKNPLPPEAALGTVVLLVSLPIAVTLLYIFGVSIADAIRKPGEYWPLWGFAVGWVIAGIRLALSHYKRSHGASTSGEAAN